MFNKEGILFVVGGFLGWVVFILPHVLWLDASNKLNKENFVAKLLHC